VRDAFLRRLLWRKQRRDSASHAVSIDISTSWEITDPHFRQCLPREAARAPRSKRVGRVCADPCLHHFRAALCGQAALGWKQI